MAVLQLLDCLKDLEKCAEEEPENCGRTLTGYVREHSLTKAAVDRFLVNYLLKIYKAIYETGVDFGRKTFSNIDYSICRNGQGGISLTPAEIGRWFF